MPNRRQFLITTAAAGMGYWVAGGATAKESRSPNERIAFASIGVNGKGASDSADAGDAGDMVAICDVDDVSLNTAGERRFTRAKRFNDFRKMFDEMGKSIDAVTVSIPDHCHAVAAAMALRLKKHCFVQKPLTRSIHEARVLAELARENGVATMMGNQGTANSGLRKAAAATQAGVLGTVKEVHVWTDRPIWPQGGNRPKSVPPPAALHWDLWLGPSHARPYGTDPDPLIMGYHPFKWRGWWDFGSGALGDMACHIFNMPFAALNLRDPVSVQAECSGHNGDCYPKWSVIQFDFPATDKRPAVKAYWYDGGKIPKAELFEGRQVNKGGALLVGEKGKIYSPGDTGEGFQIIGHVTLPKLKFVKSPGHFAEWVRAIKGGEPAMSNIPDYAGPLTETILLGNLAVWAAASGKGEKVEWDAKNLKVKNLAGLEEIVEPVYRKGYSL
jgi:predicted dehydrogenase